MTFKEYSFRELLINIVDNRGRTCPTSEHGIPLIATNCIKNSGLYPVYEKLRYVSEETYQTWFRGHPEPGDMIFVCKGSPGRVCWTPDPVPFCIAQDMVAIRADTTKVYPKYLFALLRSEAVQHQILNMHVGTLIPHFKKGDFANLYLQIPEDMEYQRRVGDAYFSFCESIEKNHQINQTLEQMAQAIFKSWFVDFEPVKAKIAALEAGGSEEDALLAAMQAISGKGEAELTRLQAEQPEQYAELRATAELFPSAMQDSELGEIPEGWTVGTLADVANLNQQSWTKRTIPSEIRYVDLANTKNGVIESTTTYIGDDAPSRARRILSDGDTIVGTVRPGNRSFAFIKRPHKTLTGSTGFAALSPKQAELAEFVYITATSDEAINHLAHLADGGAYPAVRPEVVINLPCIVPTERLIAYFHKTVRSFFDQAAGNKLESSTLSVLRDMLLPKLLSGELSVSATEDQLAEPANV